MKGISFLLLLVACSTPHSMSVREKLDTKTDEFRSCFLESNSYKGRHAPDTGKIKATFTIDPEGKVTKGKITYSDFKDTNMHVCMLEQLSKITFEKPKDGGLKEVTEELNFHRQVK